MQDSAWAVQAAVYSLLAGAGALTAQLAGGAASVFDHAPQGSPFPYVMLGSMNARPFETQAGGGYDIIMDVLTFSRGMGVKETRSIMAAVFDALHEAPLSVPGQAVVLCRLAFAETQLEQDGETRRGLQRFRIVTEPA